MNKLLKSNKDGFTLIEVLFSVVILAVGLLGLAAMQMTAIKGNSYGTRMNTATELIEDKLEEFRDIPFADIADEDYAAVQVEDGTPGNYERKVEVVNGPVTDAKTITVTVRWNDNNGPKSHEISVSTIMTD